MRHTRTSRRSAKLSQQLRNEAGRWLRELRERRGLSQRDLAKRVGADNHTFISQLEHGRCRIPQGRYLAWAHALGVEPRKFVRALLCYYDPMTYDIIFAVKKRHAPLKVMTRSRDQHDAVQDLRPDSVEPHALEPIGGPESRPASARSSHNGHLISQGDQFELQRGAAANAERQHRDGGGKNRHRARDATVMAQNSRAFFGASEF